MKFNWNAKNYREIVNDYLGFRQKRRPRGAIKRLAMQLSCHSTFISQVMTDRADFSPEQGIKICLYFQFNLAEQDYFLTLMARDRSGTVELRNYHQQRINKLLEKRRDLKPKKSVEESALMGFEGEYFGNWTYQAVHALTQIESYQTVSAISKVLNLSSIEVDEILNRLKLMKLVSFERTRWRSRLESVHLAKDSPYIRPLRVTWKTKLLADLQNNLDMEGTRYTGVITIAEEDYQRVRDILVRALEEIRESVEKSAPEQAHILSIDCYKF